MLHPHNTFPLFHHYNILLLSESKHDIEKKEEKEEKKEFYFTQKKLPFNLNLNIFENKNMKKMNQNIYQ